MVKTIDTAFAMWHCSRESARQTGPRANRTAKLPFRHGHRVLESSHDDSGVCAPSSAAGKIPIRHQVGSAGSDPPAYGW
jgi:hypothetical protein